MNLHPQYVIDAAGNRTSVILPIQEYQTLLDSADQPDAQELAESEAAWRDWLSGDDEGMSLQQARQALLDE